MGEKINCFECIEKGFSNPKGFSNIGTHLKTKHHMSVGEYLLKFPKAKHISDDFRSAQKKWMEERYKRTDIDYRKIAGSRTFDFIKNQRLRSILQRDYKSAKVCLEKKLWKPSIILYGSLIEAILRERTKTDSFGAALDSALNKEIVSEAEFHQIYVLKDSRNFVHLHKELEEGVQVINDNWAKTLSDICESLIKRFRSEEKL